MKFNSFNDMELIGEGGSMAYCCMVRLRDLLRIFNSINFNEEMWCLVSADARRSIAE